MAVTYDNSAKNTVGQTSTVVTVCTLTIGANAVLLAGIHISTNLSVSACAVNGTTMTQLGRTLHTSQGGCVALFGLTAPPSGIVSISANVVGGGAASMFLVAASYLGASGASPFGTIISKTESAVTSCAISLSTSNEDVAVVFACGFNSFSFTATESSLRQSDGNHQISRWIDAAGTSAVISFSASCVVTSQNLYWIGVNINATSSAAPSTLPCWKSLIGVGV